MPKKYIKTKLPQIFLCIDCKRQMDKKLRKQERCYICEAAFIKREKNIAQIDAEYKELLRKHHQLNDC